MRCLVRQKFFRQADWLKMAGMANPIIWVILPPSSVMTSSAVAA